jgi:hypothetical protein
MALDISLFVLFYLGIVLYVRLIGPTGLLINTNNSYPPQPFQYIKKTFLGTCWTYVPITSGVYALRRIIAYLGTTMNQN